MYLKCTVKREFAVSERTGKDFLTYCPKEN